MPFRFALVAVLLFAAVSRSQVSAVGSFQGPIPIPVPPSNVPNQQQSQGDQPPGSIEGQVLNAVTGEPIKRANLMLMPMQPQRDVMPYSTTTDAMGNFVMKNIPPGTYQLMADKTGYVRTNYGARGAMRPGSGITILSGQTVKQLSFRLQPHGVIAGRVTDEDGEAVANVQVQALTHRYMQGKRQLMPSGGGSTNDLGEYRIFGLGPGRYFLSATYRQAMMFGPPGAAANPNQPDEGYAPTYYPGGNDPTAAVPIAIAAGRPALNTDLKLSRTRTVRVKGQVINPFPNTSGRTMVMMTPRDSGFGYFDRNLMAPQTREGKFEIAGVTPGSYYLVARYMDERQYMGLVALNVGNANVEGVEVTLKAGMELSGVVRVEGETKPDLASLNINLQPKEIGPMFGGSATRVKDDGTFSLKNVFSETYRVGVYGGGQTPYYVKSVLNGDQEAKNGEITLVDGAPPSLTVVLSAAGGAVQGQVRGEKETPAQGAMVVLVPAAEKREQMQLFKQSMADQYGKFSLKGVAPGDYTLYAWDNVEPGAWQDPEFLAKFDTKAKKISVKENDSLTADLELIKNEESQ